MQFSKLLRKCKQNLETLQQTLWFNTTSRVLGLDIFLISVKTYSKSLNISTYKWWIEILTYQKQIASDASNLGKLELVDEGISELYFTDLLSSILPMK